MGSSRILTLLFLTQRISSRAPRLLSCAYRYEIRKIWPFGRNTANVGQKHGIFGMKCVFFA